MGNARGSLGGGQWHLSGKSAIVVLVSPCSCWPSASALPVDRYVHLERLRNPGLGVNPKSVSMLDSGFEAQLMILSQAICTGRRLEVSERGRGTDRFHLVTTAMSRSMFRRRQRRFPLRNATASTVESPVTTGLIKATYLKE